MGGNLWAEALSQDKRDLISKAVSMQDVLQKTIFTKPSYSLGVWRYHLALACEMVIFFIIGCLKLLFLKELLKAIYRRYL